MLGVANRPTGTQQKETIGKAEGVVRGAAVAGSQSLDRRTPSDNDERCEGDIYETETRSR